MITRVQNKQILSKNNEQPMNLSNNDIIKIMNKNRQEIKGKRGRPRKRNDTNLTAAKREGKINKGKLPKINDIIYSKNSIQFRNDNIVHLINLNGKYLDKNTEILIKNKNIKPNLSFTENNIEIVDIDNKKLFMVYVGGCGEVNEKDTLLCKGITNLLK